MKCIKCNKDAKRMDRDAHHRRCPSCRHPFVTEPADDGITDKVIQTAEDLVSAGGIFYFLQAHLHYQLLRRTRKKLKWWAWGRGIALLLLVPSIAFAGRGGTWLIAIISGLCLLVGLVRKFTLNNTISRLKKIVTKWVQINPNEKLLTVKNTATAVGKPPKRKDLETISFERVLICDRDEYVDFFLANLFHFHYSCPVLGGNKYPAGVCSDMLQRLKTNPELEVFLLHDYTPQGYAFARHITNDPYWFGGTEFNIIDLGLLEEQQSLFKSMLVNSRDLAATNRTSYHSRKHQKVTEVTLFKPETLISLCGIAINEGVPLHEISSNNNDSSGYG